MAKTTDSTASGGARWAVLAAAGLIAAIIGLSLSFLIFGGGPQREQLGGAFELVDQNGAQKTEAVLEDRLSLVYFGFTYCPDFCPTELANMVAARDEMRKVGVDPQLVFISIDPERDDPETLKSYLELFGDDILGLTGSPAQVAVAAKAYRAIYQRVPMSVEDPSDYTMSHTTQLYAVGPNARVFHRFPAATPPDVIAQRMMLPN